MKITYTGRQVELAPAQLRKIEAKFTKLGKMLDGKEQREAHVILALERHLHKAEVTVHYHNHPLVGAAADGDMFTAIYGAIERLEKQAIKVKSKWRDTKRTPRKAAEAPPAVEAAAQDKRIFRVNHHGRRKPMTVDEAVMEMEKDLDYLVYRDAETDRLAVLLRRRDGNFDLVEA
jgi:putative sigma-54 modulation protein